MKKKKKPTSFKRDGGCIYIKVARQNLALYRFSNTFFFWCNDFLRFILMEWEQNRSVLVITSFIKA